MTDHQIGNQADLVQDGKLPDNQASDESTRPVCVGSQADTKIRQKSHRRKKMDYCCICSDKDIIGYRTKYVRHKHFSSKVIREISGVEGSTEKEHYCSTCKVVHGSQGESELHNFWNPSHDSKINDLTAAWEITYFQEKRPMDVLLVAGAKNVARGFRKESILRAFSHFIDLVNYQGSIFHPDTPNTCSIATMLYCCTPLLYAGFQPKALSH